jgi:hypothetical protein
MAIDDNTVVEMTIGELTAALAEALRSVSVKREKQFEIGEEVLIRAIVTGQVRSHVNVVFAGVPEEMLRSYTFPSAVLVAADKGA